MSTSSIKCVFVGERLSGKKCLISRIVGKPFNENLNTFDAKEIDNDGSTIELRLSYVSSHEGCDRFRILWYENPDVIVHCRSVVIEKPSEELSWEYRQYCRNVPIILVGTKIDLRNKASFDNNCKVSTLIEELDASAYVECSSLTGEGIDKVIELIVTSAKDNKVKCNSKRVDSKCLIS